MTVASTKTRRGCRPVRDRSCDLRRPGTTSPPDRPGASGGSFPSSGRLYTGKPGLLLRLMLPSASAPRPVASPDLKGIVGWWPRRWPAGPGTGRPSVLPGPDGGTVAVHGVPGALPVRVRVMYSAASWPVTMTWPARSVMSADDRQHPGQRGGHQLLIRSSTSVRVDPWPARWPIMSQY